MCNIFTGFIQRIRDNREINNTIESYLESDGFELFSDSSFTIVYVKNTEVVEIRKIDNGGNILYDINGKILFNIGFIPSVTFFKYLIKNSKNSYDMS